MSTLSKLNQPKINWLKQQIRFTETKPFKTEIDTIWLTWANQRILELAYEDAHREDLIDSLL